jgi:hypothetical protein
MEKEVLLKVEVDRAEAQKELEAVNRQLLDNKKSLTELNTTFKAGKVSTDQYIRETISLKKTQKELTESQRTLTKEIAAEAGSVDQLRLRLSALTKERNATNLTTKEGAKKAKELNEEIFKTTEAIKKQEEAGGDFRRNVGNYGKAFGDAVGGVNVFGTSLNGLFKIITTNPIGIIVTALFGLLQALKQNDTIATFFKGTMTGLGVVLDKASAAISEVALGVSDFLATTSTASAVVKDIGTRLFNFLIAPMKSLIDVIPVVGALMKGEFSKAATLAGEAALSFGKSLTLTNNELPDFVDNITDAVKVGIEYEKALDSIEEKQSKLNVTIAKLTNERDRLLLQSKDLAKSEEERIALNEKAEEVNKRILKERLGLLDEEIQAQKKYVEQLGSDSNKREAAQFRLNDLEVQRLQFQNEAIAFDEKAQNKRNAIIEKQLNDSEKLKEKERKDNEERYKNRVDFIAKTEEADNKLQEFRLQQDIKNAQSIQARIVAELALEEVKKNELLGSEHLLASEKLFIVENYEARKKEIVEKGAKDEIKINRATAQAKYTASANLATSLSQLAKEGSDTQKALAVTSIAIDTAKAIAGGVAAAEDIPYPGNLVAIATTLAVVLSNIAQADQILSAAAGGGDFVTTKPTLLLVGDNPGGRERVTVEPLSGKGKTKVHKDSGMIAMAGGGTLTAGPVLTKSISGPISQNALNNSVLMAIQNMPAPVLTVKEYSKVSNRVSVKETIKNL